MDLIFFQIALVLYLAASIAYPAFLVFSKSDRAPGVLWVVVAGFVCHSLSILHRGIFSGFVPLATAFDSISFLAWLIIGIFFFVRYREPTPVFGALFIPTALVLMLVGSLYSHQITQPIVPVLRSWWLPLHVILAMAGNGVFAVVAMGGLLYLVQEYLIKKKRIGRLHRLLPSLETLDTFNRHGLPVGFFLQTLGIITGALWAGSAWGEYWTWDPKETWSLITWFAYAAMIHQRIVLGWRGKRTAVFAIIGFALVMFTFIGVNTLMGGHHGFDQSPRFGRRI